MRNYLIIDGKSSKDFDLYISGGGTFSSPEKIFEEVTIPGRNGSLYIYSKAYKNIDVSYESFIFNDVRRNMINLRSFLLSRKGYFRIEDTYHPDEFRLGVYNDAVEPDMHQTLEVGQFELTFNCKPQRFLKKYENRKEFANGSVFINETYFDALPLIRVYGTGTFYINDQAVIVTNANEYTDIDCEIQEAYKDELVNNCNANIILGNLEFPTISPGDNLIRFSGFSRFEMAPRLYVM